MAFLMLFTSTGYAMDMHICQGEVEFISFFGKAKSCHDAQNNPHKKMEGCHNEKMTCHDTSDIEAEDNCCHNETIVVQGDDYSKVTPSISSDLNIHFFSTFVAVYFLKLAIPSEDLAITSYTPEPPPPLGDIQVLHQSFLL